MTADRIRAIEGDGGSTAWNPTKGVVCGRGPCAGAKINNDGGIDPGLLALVATGVVACILLCAEAAAAAAAAWGAVTAGEGIVAAASAACIWLCPKAYVAGEMILDAAGATAPGGRSPIDVPLAPAVGRAATVATGEVSSGTAPRGGVYTLRDVETDAVVRSGRSKVMESRRGDHANDPVLGKYQFREEYLTDDYAEQRGLEQYVWDLHPEAQVANGGYNYIRAISLTNPRLGEYTQAAQDFLDRTTR